MSRHDRLERELYAAANAHPRDDAKYVAVLERALRAYESDPAAAGVFDLAGLYFELATAYEGLGQIEDALAAADASIAAGLEMTPDPRCLRAEILMRAGRVAEAEPIWLTVRADTPEEVWLYQNAGLEYAEVGEYHKALDWLTDGLRLALRAGDPERLVDGLTDLRGECLEEIGLAADALQSEATAFLKEREQTGSTPSPFDDEEPLAHSPERVGAVSVAWFPAGDYEQALALWPDFAGSERVVGPDGPVAHRVYCRRMQEKLAEFAAAGFPGLAVAAIRMVPFTAWCAERGQEPDSAETRAAYAADLTAYGDPDVVPWPPGRNQQCWCGSGRKYKKCCGATSFIDTEVAT